jgi:hypothetical protein
MASVISQLLIEEEQSRSKLSEKQTKQQPQSSISHTPELHLFWMALN